MIIKAPSTQHLAITETNRRTNCKCVFVAVLFVLFEKAHAVNVSLYCTACTAEDESCISHHLLHKNV